MVIYQKNFYQLLYRIIIISNNKENNNKIKYMIDREIGELGYGVDDNPGYNYGIKLIAFENNYNSGIEYIIMKMKNEEKRK